MPQIDQIAEIYASQLFWLVLVFGLILIGSYIMLPKIQGTVDARNNRIGGDLAAAEAARAAADQADEAYQQRLNTSRSEAQAAQAEAKAQAAAAIELRVKAGDKDIAVRALAAEDRLKAQQAEAVSGIEALAAEVTQEIVAKVSGLSVDRDAAARAVKSALAA